MSILACLLQTLCLEPLPTLPALPAAATYVVNRNINYTNVCTFACAFCAFRWGRHQGIGGGRAECLSGAMRLLRCACIVASPPAQCITSIERSCLFPPGRSKGKAAEELRGAPYLLPLEEVARRTAEAWERGATEVCMQVRRPAV